MNKSLRARRISLVFAVVVMVAAFIFSNQGVWRVPAPETLGNTVEQNDDGRETALSALEQLVVKGRAPKTGYQRAQFGVGWASERGCDMRNTILARDLSEVMTNEKCQVTQGTLQDPYTGKQLEFIRGPETSQAVQIDHVVALSNAWQTGAQQLNEASRIRFANDPLNLLAVDGAANQAKGDGDAATWLPQYKPFRCQYVARQIAVKQRYNLWVVNAEKAAMQRVLSQCPGQRMPV